MTSKKRWDTNRRIKATRRLMVLGFALLLLPLTLVQVVNGPSYAASGIKDRTKVSTLYAPRGMIYDRKGQVLATTTTRYNVVADPTEVANFENWVEVDKGGKQDFELEGVGAPAAAKLMAPILHMDQAELGGLLTQRPHSQAEGAAAAEKAAKATASARAKDPSAKATHSPYESRYSLVAKGVTPAVMRQINELRIPGIAGVYMSDRIYPRGDVAANVVGFMRVDDKDSTKSYGAAGIEQIKEDLLKSKDGRQAVEIGANGVPIPGGFVETTPAVKGTDVHLTLDADLTDLAQRLADQTREKYDAEWVQIVTEEVKTGRILALGDSGVVSPSNAKPGQPLLFGSRAVKNPYPPGSTGKLITFATALEKGKIKPDTPIMTYGTWTAPNGQVFHDSHEHAPEQLTAAGVLAQSSNTGTIQIGEKVTDQERYDMMRAFGWGEKTGVDLPAESRGILQTPDQWDGRQRFNTMYGQGVAATPLQVVDMVATLGNGGVANKVHLIEGYTRPDGTYQKVELGKPKQVVSANTAKTVVRMMEGVVSDDGTAPKARIDGYNVAAKTGTSQILTQGGGFVASIAGLVPAENPSVAILVVVYRPKGDIYGGVVAVDPFREMATRSMATLGVPPSPKAPDLFPQKLH